MKTKTGNIHLEIQTSRKNPVGLIRTTSWDKKNRTYVHTQLGRITGISLPQLQMLQKAFREEVAPLGDGQTVEILRSRELGASQAILKLAKELRLDHMLYSRREPWVDSVLAMIAGRIIYQGSKLSLCNQWQNTALWDMCGVEGRPDVEKHCYAPLDRLLERQKAIQKKLSKKRLNDGALVLYDITSTYFEGEYEQSDIVNYGYNRDRKKGTAQVVVGLLTSVDGCPIGCEVFEGNTNDSTTVMGKIDQLRQDFGLERFVFVGDRGMVTQGRFEEIHDLENIDSISALTHGQLSALLERKVIQLDLFDEEKTVEIIDPDDHSLRYCLCKNPVTQQETTANRRRLIELTEKELERIANYKKGIAVEKLGARVGKVLGKYKMGKFLEWSIEADQDNPLSRNHKLIWNFDEEKIAKEQRLDGCYIIRTDVIREKMDTESVVKAYKSLGNVERAFRNLKTVQLEMRPIYHKTDDRIRAHIFLCMLAYYVQWHMQQRLAPLFEDDGKGSRRQWTFVQVIESLKMQCRHTLKLKDVEYEQDGGLSPDQERIMDLLSGNI